MGAPRLLDTSIVLLYCHVAVTVYIFTYFVNPLQINLSLPVLLNVCICKSPSDFLHDIH